MGKFEYLVAELGAVGETRSTVKARTMEEAFRKVLDKLYGRSYGWHPEGRHDSEPDYYGWIWFRGYTTRWSRKANAHCVESPLLRIKIRPTTEGEA